MKFHYYSETDSLYIELTETAGADSQEVTPGMVLDFDANGTLVGIDIDHASMVANLSGLQKEEPTISVRDTLRPTERFLPTDVNRDGIVNHLDLQLVVAAQGARPGDQKYEQELDVNRDGVIDILDIAMVGADYGRVSTGQ